MRTDDTTYICGHTPNAAMYEQLAEEATELAHAALKYARVLRQESPTPVTREQAAEAVRQEYNDLLTVALMAPAAARDDTLIKYKITRWRERLEQSI